MTEGEQLLTEKQVAEYLNVTVRTVQRWRAEETGPPVLYANNRPRYRKAAVDAWLQRKAEEP
jgi:phage terminase Nu1 subunit (DNA packaging protein)